MFALPAPAPASRVCRGEDAMQGTPQRHDRADGEGSVASGSGNFLLDPEAMLDLAEARHAEYVDNDPFPHIVIDDFFPDPEVLRRVVREFPDPEDSRWLLHEHQHSLKLACNDLTAMGPTTLDVLLQCNAYPMTRFLERLTGIRGLIADPGYEGGGMHRIARGGHLGVHADFNRLDALRLDRRLNLLIYLNEEWDEAWGGHLELWDESMSRCVKRVAPRFNRIVVFSTTDKSFHGHPDALACPPDRARCSLALYYYTNGRPEHEASDSHSTLYKDRPGEPLRESAVKHWARRLLPPILLDGVRAVRGRG